MAKDGKTKTRHYKTLADIYGTDSTTTYHGGKYKNTNLHIRNISASPEKLTAFLDVANDYTDHPNFHLAFVDTSAVMAQLVMAYRCYSNNSTHQNLTTSRLAEYLIRYSKPIRKCKDILIEIEEVERQKKRNIYHVVFNFIIEKGKAKGQIYMTEQDNVASNHST